ncbi:hypothetical protein AB0M46_23035 [Dactylosporangium sp. NPDC051485]|uniref:hypothetical protein n=1 Tax=Dactylosporangium sp. NPDC051485 TaxID=3154846 RepID=UPI00343A7EA5
MFIDADLIQRSTQFVTGLLGPLLADEQVRLVKGFYDRVLDLGACAEGGRVTELVASAARHPPTLAVEGRAAARG